MTKETLNFSTAEVRAADRDGERYIEGHAAVFNQLTDIAGQFYEVIERGAFDGCDLSDVAFFVNHDTTRIPLARSKNGTGTLTLWVDNKGLAFRASLDVENNVTARDLYSAVVRGDIRGCSFAFQIDRDEWENLDSEMPTRHVLKIKRITEISPCTFPAYTSTDITARAKLTLESARKDLDKMTYEEFSKYMKRYQADNVVDNRTEREKDLEEYERRKAAAAQPPEFIQGTGFVSAGEQSGRIINDLETEKRTRAGELLKDSKAVTSPYSAFGERRALTVNPPSGQNPSIVIPGTASTEIKADFPVVSSLVDAVAHLSLPGGESFKQPYIADIAAGAYSNEGEDAVAADTVFNFSAINRAKITAYCELTEELEKLPAASYADVVFQNIRTSMRKLLTHEILVGKGISDDGNQPRLVGIFSDRATAIDPATDLEISGITDTTLDEIVYHYGGEEQVENPATLFLSKLDLLAFSKVRTSNKQSYYDIKFNSGIGGGTINGIPFIVDSACKPISVAGGAQSGEYVMAYGSPQNYLLCEFSPLKVRRSDDFKFRQGIVCFKGTAFVGGNCIRRNGFLRVKRQ